MKAIVMNAYGSPDILELKEVDKPSVAENDVLVRVHAVGLNAGDYFIMRGSPWLDPEACTGCTLCARNCSVSAIRGEPRELHVIDTGRCTKCGVCYDVCKFNAVILE